MYGAHVSKAPAKPRTEPNLDAMTFEKALEQVESIISRIEAGEVGLEESITEYERGVRLISHCRSKLSGAQRQIEDLTRKLDSAGEPDDKEVTAEGDSAAGDPDSQEEPPF